MCSRTSYQIEEERCFRLSFQMFKNTYQAQHSCRKTKYTQVSRSVQAERRRVRQSLVESGEVGQGVQPTVRRKELLVGLKKPMRKDGNTFYCQKSSQTITTCNTTCSITITLRGICLQGQGTDLV